MTLAIAIAVALAATTALGAARMRTKTGSATELRGTCLTLADLETVSYAELDILLERLEREAEPESVMGAMCYGAVIPSDSLEYVCPVCCEKTYYSSYQYSPYDMSRSRRLYEDIEVAMEMETELDESLYCQFCTPSSGETPCPPAWYSVSPGKTEPSPRTRSASATSSCWRAS
jgi:hypothetical protein